MQLAFSHAKLGNDSKAYDFALKGISMTSDFMQREGSFLKRKDREALFFQIANSIEIFLDPQRCRGCEDIALLSRLNSQGLLQEMERRQSLLISAPGPQQKLAADFRSLQQKLSSIAIGKDQRQRLQRQSDDIEQKLYRTIPELKSRVVSVQQIANVLPVDAVLIEFVRLRSIDVSKPRGQQWGPGRYVALILRSNGSVQTVELGPAEDIEALIILALNASEQSLDNAPQLWSQVSQEIIKPLAQATKGMKTWFISPDGELNRVPFAALSSPHSPSLLSEAVQLRVLTSGRDLLDLKVPSTSASSRSLVVSNPSFDRVPVSSYTTVLKQKSDRVSQTKAVSKGLVI